MKKSGLADSPLFSASPQTKPGVIILTNGQQQTPTEQVVFRDEGKKDETPSDKTERNSVRNSERKNERTEIRSERLPVKRLSRRYSFEFYDDQIQALKRLKHQAEMQGQKITLSDIARDALDEYLNKK